MDRPVERDEERLAALESVWYEIVEAVQSGRTAQLSCPECQADGLTVETEGDRVLVSCGVCRRTLEFRTSAL